MGKKEGAAAPKELAPDKNLLSDVKAFAAQLGLSGGPGGAHSFDDFAPSAAAKKIAPHKSAKPGLGPGAKSSPGTFSAGQKNWRRFSGRRQGCPNGGSGPAWEGGGEGG